MKVTNEMVNDFCLVIIESEDEPSWLVGDSVRNDVRKGLQAVFNAMPKQEPVGYVYTHRLKELNDVDKDCVFFKYAGSRDSKWFTPLYTHPQPQPPREPMSVTRHEVETAMMLCEINFCENPSEYVYWILDKLEIGVEK